jgi:hypothetical protein
VGHTGQTRHAEWSWRCSAPSLNAGRANSSYPYLTAAIEGIPGATAGASRSTSTSSRPRWAPGLEPLDRLVGTWKISGEAEGESTYEWMEGGFFLIARGQLKQGERGLGAQRDTLPKSRGATRGEWNSKTDAVAARVPHRRSCTCVVSASTRPGEFANYEEESCYGAWRQRCEVSTCSATTSRTSSMCLSSAS